ncbi:MAG: ComEA family DNA-binding protein [Candidatus Daviesbacteria bacterium]|nr:ComEA family DNA-binding protein [Candidatus Daviesbacteria bacterium]
MPNEVKHEFWTKVEQYKVPIALSLVGLVLISGGMFASGINKPKQEYRKESIVESIREISVDVSGAVNKPGVYQLKEGDRVEEAIAAAAGFSNEANNEYIAKSLNMAAKLADGAKIYVPYGDEMAAGATQGGVAGVATQSKVNVNTASQTELETLSGVGPVTASKIISNRPYQNVEDLLNKKVVGKATFEKIKDSVVVF